MKIQILFQILLYGILFIPKISGINYYTNLVLDQPITSNSLEKIKSQIKSQINKNNLLVINSTGGDFVATINFIEWLKNSNHTIDCVGINVHSSAFVIYQYCKTRYFTNQSNFLIHEPYLEISGTFEFVSNYLSNDWKQIYSKYKLIWKHIANRLKINPNEFASKMKNDWVILPNDAIKYNIADEMAYMGIGYRE